MALVIVDSSDMDAVLADARDEVVEQKAEASTKFEEEKIDKPDEDDEDEHGLTRADREGMTQKMLKTIGKKHRMLKEAEEFAAAQYNEKRLAEAKIADYEKQIKDLEKKGNPQEEPQEYIKPVRYNFANEDEFIEALTDWKTEQKFRQRETQSRKEAEDLRQQQIVDTAKQRLSKAAELIDDFAEVTSRADVMIPPDVVAYMQESDMFAELGYYFAKNPADAVSLSKLNPRQQLVKVGQIEAKLKPFTSRSANSDSLRDIPTATRESAKPSIDDTDFSPRTKPRNAAPVIKPISSSDASMVDQEPADMNTREMISDWSRRNKTNFNIRRRH